MSIVAVVCIEGIVTSVGIVVDVCIVAVVSILRLPLFRLHCTNICIVDAIVACIVARIVVGFVAANDLGHCCRCVYCCMFVRRQCGHFAGM
jgi:hypothetical protein